MAKLETNLDACQLSSEILLRLRKVLRETLRATYGREWEQNGIPPEMRDFLTQRQAREASINWNLSDTVDILDFAGYINIYEIISATPTLHQRFLPLAPDASLLRIRFLELDTILNRIAYARIISESDLGFLASFEDRLKKTLSGPAPAVEETTAPSPVGPPTEAAGTGAASTAAPARAPSPPSAAAQRPAPASRRKPAPAEPVTEAEDAKDGQTEAAPPTAEAVPPAAEAVPATAPPVGPQDLENALRREDNKTILTALYQEVTALADGLWNGAVASLQARAWEKVRESQWYHDRFAKLGLKPISDFFQLFDTAKEKTLAGTSRTDLQEFLKEHNFVQVLLALKDLFRAHMKP
jgi:hypothetical protein